MIIKAIRLKKRHLGALTVLTALVLSFLALQLNRYLEDMTALQSVAALSPSVANKVIIIDPGNGELGQGAAGKNGVPKKDVTLALGKRLAVYLEQAGAKVRLTGDTDTDLSAPGTADSTADLLISFTVSSNPGYVAYGVQTFVPPGSTASKQAGQAIQSELAAKLKLTDQLTKVADDNVTWSTSMPAVLVETRYDASTAGGRMLQDPAYQKKVSWAVYAGIVKYFNGAAAADAVPGKEEIIKIFKAQSPDILSEP